LPLKVATYDFPLGDLKMVGVIHGIVLDRKGKPVTEARVSFVSGPISLPDIAALTDINGTFALTAPASGTYTIEVVSEEFAPKKVSVTVAGNQKEYTEILLESR
jgi:uncharacterized GH25 family protein